MSSFEMFFILLKINALTFGGGYTIAPVIRQEFVEKRGLISNEDMLNILAVAQSGPGALAVSTSLLVGYKVKGVRGAIASLLGAITPPLVIISLVYIFYEMFEKNIYIRAALRGMSGVIAGVLIVTCYQLIKDALKRFPIFSSTLAILSFLVAYFTKLHVGIIILALALIGLISFSIVDESRMR